MVIPSPVFQLYKAWDQVEKINQEFHCQSPIYALDLDKKFEACDWRKEKVLLNSIVASSNVFSWVGYICGSKKYYCIVGVISLLEAYSITWVSKLIRCTNRQC